MAEFQFLKCDAEGCEHQERMEALVPELIGKPCPACGANLLTGEDYHAGIKSLALQDILLALGVVRHPTEEELADPASPLLSVNPHAGDLNITLKGAV